MILISAEKEGLDVTENARRSAKLVCALVDLVGFDAKVIPTEGCWNNIKEQSYIIQMTADTRFVRSEEIAAKLFELANEFEQEALGFINLESNPPRMGTITTDGKENTSFGVCVSNEEPPPEATDSWFKMGDLYYFPYGELTILDDLSGCTQIAGAEADILVGIADMYDDDDIDYNNYFDTL